MTTTTLATEVVIQRPDGVTHQKDIPVMVDNRRGKTYVTLGWANAERVAVTLTEGERIALIEALGGFTAPAEAVALRFYDASGSQVSATLVKR